MGCSLEGQILRLRLQCFGYVMRGEDSLEETLMLGKIEGTRMRRQRMRWLVNVLEAASMGLIRLMEVVEVMGAWRALVHGIARSWKGLNNNNFCN